jgi:sugar (pentulose or hexulose) kinase
MGVYASEHTPWAVGTTSLNLAARALHLKRHDPTVLGKTAYLGGVKDYLLLRLTGNWVTDSSSGPPDGEWISELFGYAGINAETLPGILPAGAIAGRLTDKAASDIGLPSGLPVSVGAMDGVCASIGAGVVSPGDACITLGTNGVLRLTSRFPIRSGKGVHSFFYRFIDDLWATGGDVASAGAFIQQLGRVLGSKNLESLDAKASKVPVGSQGLLCVPLPVGMVSPRLMPFARASFSGIGLNHGPEHLFRAAMEGVACSLRDIRDMAEAHGINVAYARITGGGARSGSWPQIISSMLGIPVSLVEPLESNRGAGVLLVVAMGIYPSVQEACSRMVRTTRDLAPVPGHALIYEDTWRAYKRAVEELS